MNDREGKDERPKDIILFNSILEAVEIVKIEKIAETKETKDAKVIKAKTKVEDVKAVTKAFDFTDLVRNLGNYTFV